MQDERLRAFLGAQKDKSLLRFLTCGSVDDGKSTLIGRLLYDAKLLFDDHKAALTKDSKKHVAVFADKEQAREDDELYFALLVDGLEAEREQGITIDVAYRFFTTDKRRFIVADTPGHEQYTRNMATGASTSELAVILVDARKGVLVQTRRHAFIASLLGIRQVVLAVNKMDLMGFREDVFARIAADFRSFAGRLDFGSVVPIPLSARLGDNVYAKSENTPWYEGPTLVHHLETVEVEEPLVRRAFRLPVQWVNRPSSGPDFRGFSGTVVSGRVGKGDSVVVARSGRTSRVARIVTMDGDLEEATAGDAVTLVLDDEVDVSAGDLLADPTARPEVADQFAARLLWMGDDELLPGREYLLKSGSRTVPAQVTHLKHKVDVSTFGELAAKTLEQNDIAVANFALAEPIAFDAYRENRDTGGFILIDRFTNHTVAAGMIDFGLRRAENVHPQALDVDRATRARMKGQRPLVVWFTGLSGSGKSTIANHVERRLAARGRHTYLLDGDNVRQGLCKDLGFTEADRVENIRRVAEVSKLFVDAGLIVLVSFISPFRAEREMARRLLGDESFVLAFVDTPLDVCKQRDPKGLYAKAERGQLQNFTGIDSPYEAPDDADLTLSTEAKAADDLALEVVRLLERRGAV